MRKPPLCALVIGHTPEAPGARNHNGKTEFQFNQALSMDIVAALSANPNVDVVRVFRERYRDLPEKINALNPDFIVSLHCNAFNRRASGTETLYFAGSGIGAQLADIVQTELCKALRLPDRGIKPITTDRRGGYLLRYTRAPAVIAEPFFIDNDIDLQRAEQRINELVNAYVTAITNYARTAL